MSPQPGLGLRTCAVFVSPSGYFPHAPYPIPDLSQGVDAYPGLWESEWGRKRVVDLVYQNEDAYEGGYGFRRKHGSAVPAIEVSFLVQ